MSQRTILHVDMDAFYASIEVRDDPSLDGKPVIVGGTPEGRGVVAAASYEARKYGIHSAMSAFRAKKLCPHAVFIHPRMRHYSSVSKQIFAIFREYTPMVEPISIDEAFLDVTGSRGLFGPAEEIGRLIKRRIGEEIGLTASVGVAPNKFLAKLASDLEKPNGFVVIKTEEVLSKLAPLSVNKLWGVGKVTHKKLMSNGICTIKDLRNFPADKLEALLGSHAHKLRDLASGIDNRPVATGDESKSIGAETTFPKDIQNAERLKDILDSLAERVAKRLRKEGYRAHAIHLKARYPDFKTVTRVVTLPTATASTKTIQESVRELFEKRLDRRGRPLRLVGVSASHIVATTSEEPGLFPDDKAEQREKVDHLLDELQKKYGSQTIWRGKRRSAEKD